MEPSCGRRRETPRDRPLGPHLCISRNKTGERMKRDVLSYKSIVWVVGGIRKTRHACITSRHMQAGPKKLKLVSSESAIHAVER